jgi:hypothetical protein
VRDVEAGGGGANVHEVRRPPACIDDHVERRERKPGAVDRHADIAVEADVVELIALRLELGRVRVLRLVGVAQRRELRPPEERVVVDDHLGVERDQPALWRDRERVDLDRGRVERDERHGEVAQKGGQGGGQRGRTRDLAGQFLEIRLGLAAGELDREPTYRGRIARRARLDVLPAGGAREQHDATGDAVQGDRGVELLRAVDRLLDVDLVHDGARRAGLARDEPLAEQLGGLLGDLGRSGGKGDAARGAAVAGEDLALHGVARAAETPRNALRLRRRRRDLAERHREIEAAKQVLGLKLVDFHRPPPMAGLARVSPSRSLAVRPSTDRA